MKLGIVVNTDRHLDQVVALTRAAVGRGHDVKLFTMDEGTRLLKSRAYTELAALAGVAISVCVESAKEHGVDLEGVPKEITCGSQYHNAVMTHEADRVLVL